ncbi:hypothetical protein WMF18_11270 [Sorangium sp. So ce315]|uniref:hypothetical protein n=1 Tax=Sorangium sp. So ce315 TaxID=3133299 RepID=UPI003F5F610D
MKRTRLALSLLLAACLGGCGLTTNIEYRTCASQCEAAPDPDACIAECGTCKGQCVNKTPEGFDGPALLWVGRTADEPQCPDSAPVTVYKGYESLDDPIVCDPCRCSEPTCALPEGLRTAASATCDGAGIPLRGRQDVQNGVCIVPSEALVGDRKALLLGSPRFMPCQPSVEPPPVPLISLSRWYRSGKACAGVTREDACGSPSKTCVPAERMQEFSQCIMYIGEGEATCPEDYPEPVVLYDDVRDERHCTPCECGPPTGGECSLMLLSFRDGACGALLAAGGASGKEQGCLAPTPGVRPKSMKAVWRVNEPGRCEPRGGELKGEIIPIGPSAFCCKTRPGREDD